MWYELALAGLKTPSQRFPGITLRRGDGIDHVLAVRQQRRDGCCQGATGAVIAVRQPRPGIDLDIARAIVKRVVHFRRIGIGALDQHPARTEIHQAHCFFVVGRVRPGQRVQLAVVWRQQGGLRDQPGQQHIDQGSLSQLRATGSYQHRVEHDRQIVVLQQIGHGAADLGIAEQTDLDGAYGQIFQHRSGLVDNQLRFDRHDRAGVFRVLHGERGDYRGRVC